MALTVAGLASRGETVIDSAEAVAVTFPAFINCMTELGANVSVYSEDQEC